MPEIILINPPNELSIGPPYMHLGLAYLAGSLKADGFSVDIVDACLNSFDSHDILATVQSIDDPPILVGFTLINELAWHNTRFLCSVMKDLWPGTVFVAGGYFATFWFDEVLQCTDLDVVVLGEGEETLLDIAHHVRQQAKIQGLAGTACLVDGKVLCAPARTLIENLDTLAFPYHPQLSKILLHGGVPSVYSSRGCYHRCSFCQVSSMYRGQPGKLYRRRSVPNVLEEIIQLQEISHSNFLLFTDDEFIGAGSDGKKRALELADAMQTQNQGLHFAFQCRADSVEVSLFSRLKNAGLRAVSIGIETLIQRSLDLFDKRIRVEQNLMAIDILHDLDIDTNIGLILFDPYTTLDELATHITSLIKLPVLPQSFNGLSVLRGTALEHHFRRAQMLATRGTYYEVQPLDPAVRVFQKLTRSYNNLHRDATNYILAISALSSAFPTMEEDVRIDLRSLQNHLRDVHRYFLSTSLGFLQKNEADLADRVLADTLPELSTLSERALLVYNRAQKYAAQQMQE
jgi:anaerobic magnesium-protoporphyrin IX monomethyl ester cyclase